MKKKWLYACAFLVVAGGVSMIKVGGAVSAKGASKPNPKLDLSAFSDGAPAKPLRLLFIHHSVGGRLLAAPGPVKARADNIFETHPEGGGLRDRLTKQGYEVHEASYGSEIGEATDLFDWLPKFRQKMDKVLVVDENDKLLGDGQKHDVVVFKSCYPNNRFQGGDGATGAESGPELTVANAKATLRALLREFQKHPNTLFVYVTTPPVAPKGYEEPLWKLAVKTVLGRPRATERVAQQGKWAREFAAWAASPDGWLADYPLKNVVVFDYYDVLTDEGASDVSRYPSGDGSDSHPSRPGNEKAAAALTSLLNRAVRRMGLAE